LFFLLWIQSQVDGLCLELTLPLVQTQKS